MNVDVRAAIAVEIDAAAGVGPLYAYVVAGVSEDVSTGVGACTSARGIYQAAWALSSWG